MRSNIGNYLSIAIAVGLSACGSTEQLTDENKESQSLELMQSIDGRSAYDKVCASCHRDGVGGAPVTGDSSAWSGRSRLWMAVLAEHAMRGYLQMPARGGDETMSDAEVQAATEYMMLLAYPDLPSDQ